MLRVVTILVLLSTIVSASDTGMLKGVVKDQEGAIVPNSYVLVHRSGPGEAEDVRVKAERDGSFPIGLAPGFYDIFVTTTGFAPTCKKVEVKSGQTSVYNPRIGMSKIESAN